jgi:hypothetical protein
VDRIVGRAPRTPMAPLGGRFGISGPIVVVAVLLFGMGSAAVAMSATVIAGPSCTNVGPTTTLCQSPGNAQIVTSPGTVATPSWGWPYWGGGLAISLGGRR